MQSIDGTDRRLAFPVLEKGGGNTVTADYPSTDADSDTGAAATAISAAPRSEDAGLTGWTTSIAVGDILGFHVDSASNLTRVTAVLIDVVS